MACIILNLMSFMTYAIHRHKLNEIDECFYEIECEDFSIGGEIKEVCGSTGCDYIKKYQEYDEWREKGITSFVWRLLDNLGER